MLTVTNQLIVGGSGYGTLEITNGGMVSSGATFVGTGYKGQGAVSVDGSRWQIDSCLTVGEFSGQGRLTVTNAGSVHTSSYLYIGGKGAFSGDVWVDGEGSSIHAGGKLMVGEDGLGTLSITNGASVDSGPSWIGKSQYGKGNVTVDGEGSVWNVRGDLCIGESGRGTLSITNGATVKVDGSLRVRTDSRLNIDLQGTVRVKGNLYFGEGSKLAAGAGATAHIAGLDNASTDPADLASLENLTTIFDAGSDITGTFEVAGKDLGPVIAGFAQNFALGTMQVGGDNAEHIVLVDIFDNQPDWDGSEAMYVKNLVVGPGSVLDLNGLNLYCLNATIASDATIIGGTPIQIPEPATASLLAFGALGLLRRRR